MNKMRERLPATIRIPGSVPHRREAYTMMQERGRWQKTRYHWHVGTVRNNKAELNQGGRSLQILVVGQFEISFTGTSYSRAWIEIEHHVIDIWPHAASAAVECHCWHIAGASKDEHFITAQDLRLMTECVEHCLSDATPPEWFSHIDGVDEEAGFGEAP
jgi:hypothetical protein